jgi:SAM-dependent methyltransferase
MNYSFEFYQKNEIDAQKSAQVIAPIIFDLIKPKSVIDIGCGLGAWLTEFKKNGAEEILGIDGDDVNKDWLSIPQVCFKNIDISQSFELNRKFDLLLCLEVAEHLSAEFSCILIDNITAISNVILFSAAIPRQDGVNHLNEQWQSYWADIFYQKGFIPLDIIRPKIWNNENVCFWYRQNIFLYVHKDNLTNYSILTENNEHSQSIIFDIIHPTLWDIKWNAHKAKVQQLEKYIAYLEHSDKGLKKNLYNLWSSIKRKTKEILKLSPKKV